MLDAPQTPLQSGRFLRTLLISYWLGATALLTSLFGAIDLVERHREVVRDAEHTRDLVAAAMATPMTASSRSAFLDAYARSPKEDEIDGMNMLLVVDGFGRITYSSLPAQTGMAITDPQLSRTETNDPDFQSVVACFREHQSDCVLMQSSDQQLRLGSFTVVRPIERPARDMGLPRERLLVLVNYDPGVVLADFSQDLVVLALLSLLVAGLLTLVLWLVLVQRLLPQLAQTSQTDGLTQLVNRSLFMEQAKEQLAEAEERQGELVFAILDLDHFKRINDTFGHSCGDAALVHVADVFRAVTRPDDLICRFGGEEFAMLLNGSRDSAGRALERIRLQLEMSRLNLSGQALKLTASIGAADTAECGYNIDYLYTTADKALYEAKKAGRNRLEWTDGRITTRLAR